MTIHKYDIWLPFSSITKGLWYQLFKYNFDVSAPKAKWCIVNRKEYKRKYWCHIWTPVWHKSRGVYVTIGLGWFAIYRGY